MNKINNLPAYAKWYRYFVVRQSLDGQLWFWVASDSKKAAAKEALEINGLIIENNGK